MICDPNFSRRKTQRNGQTFQNQKYCCSYEEFQPLVEQFNSFTKQLRVLEAKVNRMFRLVKNMTDEDFTKIMKHLTNPDNKKCFNDNLFDISFNRKIIFFGSIFSFSAFINWKIEDAAKMTCFICSPNNSEFFTKSFNKFSFIMTNKTCSQNIDRLVNLDSVLSNLIYLTGIAQFMRCLRSDVSPYELTELVKMADLAKIQQKRNYCTNKSKNNMGEAYCQQMVKEAVNPLYFPFYRQFKNYSEIVYDEFNNFLKNVNFRQISEEEKVQIKKEENILGEETLEEQARIDFHSFKNYSGKRGKKILFDIKCESYGSNYNTFSYNFDYLNKFKSAVKQQKELELTYFQQIQDMESDQKSQESRGTLDSKSQMEIKETIIPKIDVFKVKSMMDENANKHNQIRNNRYQRKEFVKVESTLFFVFAILLFFEFNN
jgi:hypothetical protein